MREIWLNSNRRVLKLAMVPVGLLGLLGLLIIFADFSWLPRQVGSICLLGAVSLEIALIIQCQKPRIAFHERQVLFYLRSGKPIAVPVEVVEAFFMGQGPANLPVTSAQETKTVNLIARLSRKHPEWQERDVKNALGKWEDGYITIRGIWAEPLDTEVIRRLNHRLHEVNSNSSKACHVGETC